MGSEAKWKLRHKCECALLTSLLVICALLTAQKLRVERAEKEVNTQLMQIAEELKVAPVENYGLHAFFERVNGGDAFSQPYQNVVAAKDIDLFVFRRRLAYSGYSYDLKIYGGSHPNSKYHYLTYDYTINDKYYSVKVRAPKANYGS